jgi:hypothetical protein
LCLSPKLVRAHQAASAALNSQGRVKRRIFQSGLLPGSQFHRTNTLAHSVERVSADMHNFPSGLNKKGARGKAEMSIFAFFALRGVSISRRSAAEDCADAQARSRCDKRKTASTRRVHRQARVGSCIRKQTAQNAHRGRAQPVQQQQTAAHKVGK